MPAGFTASALVSVWPTNSSGELVIGDQTDRTISIIPASVFNGTGGLATLTALSINAVVPLNARRVNGTLESGSTVSSNCFATVAPAASGVGGISIQSGAVTLGAPFSGMPLMQRQVIFFEYSAQNGTAGGAVTINQYEI
jgi:hypothetical protein